MHRLEQIWQDEAHSAHMCSLENNISLTKTVFLNTNHIFAYFHFDSFNEKTLEHSRESIQSAQFYTGGVFVFSENSSPTITWLLQIFGEPPHTRGT